MPKIDTPTARAKLRLRRDPYWLKLDAGRYLGFRRGAETWIAKKHARHGSTAPYDYKSLGSQSSFTAAKKAAETWFGTIDKGAASHYTVEQMCADYIEHRRLERKLEQGNKSAHEADLLLKQSALKKFAGREVAEITTAELKRWRDSLVPRDGEEEAQRRAKATANKHLTVFRAAAQLAFNDGKIASVDAWRRVKAFRDVDRPRDFYPSPEQVQTLIAHCDNAFRPLVKAAVLTGFRLQALKEARVADFDPADGTLNIKQDKGHARVATLSSGAIALFKEQTKDKLPTAYVFLRADGLPWGASHQHRPFRDACARANAEPDAKVTLPREFIFYSLRHYFISRALLAGINIQALAKNVGTSVRMIEVHYGKFIRTDVRDMLDRIEVA